MGLTGMNKNDAIASLNLFLILLKAADLNLIMHFISPNRPDFKSQKI
jgi:hypothetical protein